MRDFSGFFLPALCLVLVVAKIWGVIHWSWWLVFLPVLAPLALVSVLLLGMVALAVWGSINADWKRQKRWAA